MRHTFGSQEKHSEIWHTRSVTEAVSAVDKALRLATLPADTVVRRRERVATVKVIPFATTGSKIQATASAADGDLIGLTPFRPQSTALIQTRLPNTREGVLDKSAAITARRLQARGTTLQPSCAAATTRTRARASWRPASCRRQPVVRS